MDIHKKAVDGATCSVYTGPEFDDSETTPKDTWNKVNERCKNICTVDFLKRKLPIVTWLPKYNLSCLGGDILAGFTVGMTAIPQGLGNAEIAGLPAEYGLYSGFMGAFVYIILGSCKDITIGPSAILALMCQRAVAENGEDYAVLLCFLSGCIILSLGILNLGFLVNFIPMPVTNGFTTAAAITIASTQVKSILGIKGKTNEFLESWITVFKNIKDTTLWDPVLGISSIIILLLGKSLNNMQIKKDNLQLWEKIFNNTIWFVSLGRNAIVAIIGTALAYYFHTKGKEPFVITGEIGRGLPSIEPPKFSTIKNGEQLYFSDMIQDIGTTIFTVPFISVLETIAIAQSFSKGKAVDATQEMLALGSCNIFGSFVHSMPITGSLTRTTINNASGVKTQLGGLFTGGLVLLTLIFLTSTFQYIPKATLAAIIISAMIFMPKYEVVPLLWRSRKIELFPYTVTVLTCLFWGLELGIICGTAVNLTFILYDAACPRIYAKSLKVMSDDVLLVTPDSSIVFPAAESFRRSIVKKCLSLETKPIVIIDGHYMRHIDSTVAKALQCLQEDLKVREQNLILWRWNRTSQKTMCGNDSTFEKLFRDEITVEKLLKERNNSETYYGDKISTEDKSHVVKI